MKATQQLKNDHESITIMLSVMEQIYETIKRGESPDCGQLDSIIEYIRVFADLCHHGKEEDVLFPALVAHGMSMESGPVAVMLNEHQQGRYFVRLMADALDDYKKGNNHAVSVIGINALNYTILLRSHIEKENNVLFMMADKLLTEKEQEIMAGAFEKIEVERMGQEKHEEYHRLLMSLNNIYLKK
ncbi:MAG TPA: hemerythrin domain-containing protein [Bacteroidales bacterium]|nr:hemerythrin domain-containing protein [Bacteroidales bacterium]